MTKQELLDTNKYVCEVKYSNANGDYSLFGGNTAKEARDWARRYLGRHGMSLSKVKSYSVLPSSEYEGYIYI